MYEAPEQRKAERRRRRRQVRLDPGGIQALTADISTDGAFILTSQPPEPGSRVQMTFSVPDTRVFAEGLVRWVRRSPTSPEEVEPLGMGVQFVGSLRETTPSPVRPVKGER